jgi:ADP-ribosylglycohydrolase
MIGAIAGDIIGSRFEGELEVPPNFILFHPLCRYTDDSICALAVADALLGKRDYAASLRTLVRRHPRRGYGPMFRDWALSDDAPAYGSWGNGAPMRTAAVGWLEPDEAAVLASAQAQAVVTHNHPDAVAAAQAVALAIFLLRRGETAAAVRARLTGQFGYDLRPEAALVGGTFDVSAAGTAPAALAAALEAEEWEGAVRTAIGLGGDTDTLGCIAGAVAEAIHEVPEYVAAGARLYLPEDLEAILARFESARHG